MVPIDGRRHDLIQDFLKHTRAVCSCTYATTADHFTSNFSKAVCHKFYLVHSWILCLICIHGDSAYSLRPCLLGPYKGVRIIPLEEKLNKKNDSSFSINWMDL